VTPDGRAVTSLTTADFTLRVDGIVQEIALFRPVSESDIARAGRTFVFVLGRGRLNHPARAIEALADFVRTSTLPADRVAIAAYLRVVGPTADRGAIGRFLDSFRDQHEGIESKIRRDRAGNQVRGLFPIRFALGDDTRSSIEALFDGGSTPVQTLPGANGYSAHAFDDYGYLRRTIEYLHAIEGDKHLVLLSERPFAVGRPADDPRADYWSGLAAAARTSLSFIQTGGLEGGAMYRGRMVRSAPGLDRWFREQAVVAERTGGLSSLYEYSDRPLTRLDRLTRGHYLLGYYPSVTADSRAARVIDVSVAQRGVSLIYRRLFEARPFEATSRDGEAYQAAVTRARLDEALWHLIHPPPRSSPFPAFPGSRPMRVSATLADRPGGGGTVRVVVAFNPIWVTFDHEDGHHTTRLDLGIVADGADRSQIAEVTRQLEIKLTPADYARIRSQWLEYETTLEVPARPSYVRAALYDFAIDRTTAAQASVNR